MTTIAPAPTPTVTRPRLAWRAALTVAGVKVLLNLVASPRYGWHRDELYYADAGRHLAWGYVDFPPVTPLLAAGARVLTADSLVGLRLVASLAGAVTIVVTAAVARELGGGRRAQGLAAVAITPLLVGSNAMFQTVSFDQLTLGLVTWAAVVLLRRGPTTGRWLGFGVAVALAWQTKYTAGALVAALAVGWVSTAAGRGTLRGRGPWLAGAVVLVTAVPNLLWQASHGWPSVAFFGGRNGEVRAANPPWRFALELAVITGVVAVPLAVAGVRALLADGRLRPVGVGLALVGPLWLVAGGKAYYAAPLVIGAFAAGAVRWDTGRPERTRSDLRRPAAIVVTALVAAPLIAPFLPASTMVDLGLDQLRDDYAEEVGWPELAATVDAASARTGVNVVVAGSYGSAGAVARFGRDDLVVVSGHLQWRWWPVPTSARSAREVLLVGFDRVDGVCSSPPERVATVVNDLGVDNEESGRPVWRCRLARSLLATRAHLAVPRPRPDPT